MKLPDFSPERIALPPISKLIEERFDALLGNTWRDKQPSTPNSEGSIFFSIEDLLCLLQEAPSQLKPHHRLRIWFSIEKQHPATQKNLATHIQHLWRQASQSQDFSILYLMVQCFFTFLQENQKSLSEPSSPQENQRCWTQKAQQDFMRSLLTALAADQKKQHFLMIKRLKEWFPSPDSAEQGIKQSASRVHDFCNTKKTPQEVFVSMNLPSQGDFTNTILDLCREKLVQKAWPNWMYVLWVFRVFQEQSRTHYIELVNDLLEKTPDELLKNCKDDFFSLLRKEFGHPLSAESDWKLFSEQARSRILSWGGKVQYEDYRRVHVLLLDVHFYSYINSLTSDVYGDEKRLESRYGKYWKQYLSKMRLVRFYLTPIAREWLEKHDEGFEVIREIGIGQCVGKMDTPSDAMLMEFDPFTVLEFIYGPRNNVLFFAKDVFQNHQHIFLRNELLLSEVLRLPRLHEIRHQYRWQEKSCDVFMSKHKISKDYTEKFGKSATH